MTDQPPTYENIYHNAVTSVAHEASTLDETRCRFCVYRSLNDRGENAGSLAEWDENAYANSDLSQFTIDIDQIGEIEY